jgi:hypothetical protein
VPSAASSTGSTTSGRTHRGAFGFPGSPRGGGGREGPAGGLRRALLVLRQAVLASAAVSRPSSAMETSRILNFCTLPVTVIGNSSTNRQ